MLKQQIVSKEPWTQKIGINEVMMVQELNNRAPELMRKGIVVVDAVQDSPEDIVRSLTGCFASAGDGMPELGLGSAEADVVLSAWKLHMTLSDNAAYMRRWADLLMGVSTLFVIITTLSSVLLGFLPTSVV